MLKIIYPGIVNYAKYALLRAYFAFARRAGLATSLPFFVCLSLRYRGEVFPFYIKHQLDFDLLKDTFVTEEYMLEKKVPPKIIFDLGSNIGATVVFFKLLWKDAKVFAFEPDPRNILSLKKNTARFGESVVIVEEAVVPTSVEHVTFYQAKKNHWSSSTVPRDTSTVELVVDATTLDDAMQSFGVEHIDVCKFDIEGAEYEVFTHFKRIHSVDTYIGELHYELMNHSKGEFLSLFEGYHLIETREGDVVVIEKT